MAFEQIIYLPVNLGSWGGSGGGLGGIFMGEGESLGGDIEVAVLNLMSE